MAKLPPGTRRPLFSRVWVRLGCGFLAVLAALVIALGVYIAVEVRSRFLAQYPASPADPLPHTDIVIPFTMSGGHVLIPISVNGAVVQAVVDTGAPISIIDTAYLKERAIAVRASESRVNGQAMATPVGLNLAVGGQRVSSVVATELTEIREVFGTPVILGVRGLMDNRVLEVNFPARTLTLHRRLTFEAPPRTETVRLTAQGFMANRHYGVPIRIAGQQVFALVDLGADHAVSISPDIAKRAGLRTKAGHSIISGRIEGDQTSAVAQGNVSFGPYEFRDIQIRVSPQRRAPFESWDANLGTGVTRHMHLWMDVTGRRLWFTRPPRFSIGVADSENGITGIEPDGPAAAAGLKVGDRIALIDGVRHLEYWKTRDWTSPAPITLTMEDGRTLTVTPRNKFR